MAATVFPKGVTIHIRDKAYKTHVLYDGRDSTTYLIDMEGGIVNSWPYKGFPSEMIDPALNSGETGHVFVQGEDALFDNKTLLQLDWSGRTVWSWTGDPSGSGACQAWDQARLPNGNTLVLTLLKHVVARFGPYPITDQRIVEIDPRGKIVWSWLASEHFHEFGFNENEMDFLSHRSMPRSPSLLEINNMSPVGSNPHFLSGDMRFHPENIVIDSRGGNFMAIIDKATGSLAWRMGPSYPARHDYSKRQFSGKLPRDVDYISGQHDAHIIPSGLPGAGNLLVFDNQGAAGFEPVYGDFFSASRILEIDPISKQIVWQYDASMGGRDYWTFYSSFISSARRLPNGNTLICEGMYGRIFQVTQSGETVWEYMNPIFGTQVLHGVHTGATATNWIFRAQPVPCEWVP